MKTTQLARTLDFTDIYLISLGYIIGAGIFILISKSAKYAKNYTWLAYLIAGLISILNIFSYIELSAVFTKNSSEYDYISATLGTNIGLLSSVLIILCGIFTIATVALGTGEYAQKTFGMKKMLAAILIILLFTSVNIIGVQTVSNFNAVHTIIELGALISIIIGGFFYLNGDKKIIIL